MKSERDKKGWGERRRRGEGEKVGDKDKQMFQVITQIISFNSDMNRTPDIHTIFIPQKYMKMHLIVDGIVSERERGRRERERLREKKEQVWYNLSQPFHLHL